MAIIIRDLWIHDIQVILSFTTLSLYESLRLEVSVFYRKLEERYYEAIQLFYEHHNLRASASHPAAHFPLTLFGIVGAYFGNHLWPVAA